MAGRSVRWTVQTSFGAMKRVPRGLCRRNTVELAARVVAVIAVLAGVAGCRPAGSDYWPLTFGPSNSSRIDAVWHTSEKWLELTADRLSSASGCTTVWFDWTRSGHSL